MSGRFPEERDTADVPIVGVVNETFAHTFFPHEDPIGKRVRVWFAKPTILGVVGDFKLNSLDRKPYPEIFWSLRQTPSENVWLMVRTKADPVQIGQTLRRMIREFDADLPVTDVRAMSEVISESLRLKRVSADLIGLLAVLAITLAGTGTYSVMSYSVSQRTKEVGIRVALGADRRDVSAGDWRGLPPVAYGFTRGMRGSIRRWTAGDKPGVFVAATSLLSHKYVK